MFMTHIDVTVLQNYFSFPIVSNDFARASNKSSICQFSWLTFLKPHNCLIVTKSVNLHEDTVWIVDCILWNISYIIACHRRLCIY